MKKSILTALVFLAFGYLSLAQTTFDKKKLDNYFETLEQNEKFMGSVSVSRNGEIIYEKSVGFADVERKIKATDKTKYRIGSISKSFTAVLVLKAVENNKLELDTTIDKWFPTIPNADKITVKQLLNHRSGIHNFTDDNDYLNWNTQRKTEKEMIGIISKGGSDFTPDSKAEYSNSNYVLLTYIVEKAFSESFSELLNKYVVKPVWFDEYIRFW
ncbi:MAG: serine hydrolase domain-containing protein [Myroides sp.]